MQISQLSSQRISVHIDGETYTGVTTGTPSKGYTARQVSAHAASGAMWISDNGVRPWAPTRAIAHEGAFFIVGPQCEGYSIAELLSAPKLDPRRWLPAFLRAGASAIGQGEARLCNITSTIFTKGGELLCFNSALSRQVNANLPLHERKVSIFPYKKETDTGRSADIYYYLAVAYHAIARHPIAQPEDQEQAMHAHSGRETLQPIHAHRPTADERLCTLIEEGLNAREQRTADRLRAIADRLQRLPIDEKLSAGEVEQRREAARQEVEKRHGRQGRRTFWRKHGRTIAIVSAIVIAVGSVPATIIRNALEPPVTVGMSAEEVVDLFYSSWTDLDHMTMADILAKGVGKNVIQEVTNVYVIDRVQMAHSREATMMNAERWIEENRPMNHSPYGVVNLQVTHRPINDQMRNVVAVYQMWRPESRETASGEAQAIAVCTQVTDTLRIVRDRNAWEIVAYNSDSTEVEVVTLSLAPPAPTPEE